jgi:hypothetical protein
MTLASDAVRVANQVIAALDTPWRVGAHVLRLRASIGISIYPDDGDDAATLLERADAAMYRAKRRGRAGFVFYGALAWGKTSPAIAESASTGYLVDGAAEPAPLMDSGPARRSPAVLTVLTPSTPSTPSTPPTPSAATVKDPGPPAQ